MVELDFCYPSEGIHKRWEAGYRITAAAATPDQAAFVLSRMRKPSAGGAGAAAANNDDTQETLRTSAFPTGACAYHHASCAARGVAWPCVLSTRVRVRGHGMRVWRARVT